MNYCVVPSWDLDDDSSPPKFPPRAPSNSPKSNVPSFDYEVTELTWENGQIAMHGLCPPRGGNKSATASPPWDKARAATGTLESIVSQATNGQTCNKSAAGGSHSELQVPWLDHSHSAAAAAGVHGVHMTMDALVPCQITRDYNSNSVKEKSAPCMVGSCSGAAAAAAAAKDVRLAAWRRTCGCGTNASVSESACGGSGRDGRRVTVDGFTSTSLWSLENTSSDGGEDTKISADELDHSVCHGRSQMENISDHGGKRKLDTGKSSISTKRSRAAAIHNQSERKRRDRINQRLKTLQKLVPNCSKTDKASMLDEVIEYLRQLQAQVRMMTRLSMPSMMLPLALQQQQQLQMPMMAPGMGMGVMDFNSLGRAAAAFVPMPSWDAPVDCLSPPPMIVPNDVLSVLVNNSQSQQPITMDAYSRLAALYQQFQQPPGYGSKN